MKCIKNIFYSLKEKERKKECRDKNPFPYYVTLTVYSCILNVDYHLDNDSMTHSVRK